MPNYDSKPHDLSQWLHYLEHLHPVNIDMGLARVKQVFDALSLSFTNTKVITVAGTNGKGTTCAALEALLIAHGHSVAVYSSPHIHEFTERLRVNQQNVEEQSFCDAFTLIESTRKDISLSYFEYTTLAAMIIGADVAPDFLILEVGLGGRLDAVNVLDPDLAIITTIDLDHQSYLGDTRELIGAEKAGILRHNGDAVIGEFDVPDSVNKIIYDLSVNGLLQQRDFAYKVISDERFVWCKDGVDYELSLPDIPPQNASTALAAMQYLVVRIDWQIVDKVFRDLVVAGRCQWLNPTQPMLVDVAHNPEAARYLAERVQRCQYDNLHLVVAVLEDKDIEGVLAPFRGLAHHWYLASLDIPRGASSKQLESFLNESTISSNYDTVLQAVESALKTSQNSKNDLVVVFGSFYTVADVLPYYQVVNKRIG